MDFWLITMWKMYVCTNKYQLKGKEMSTNIIKEKQEFIFPVRIVKAVGEAFGTENLLKERFLALVPSFIENRTAKLSKSGDAAAYILLDFGKELQGGIRLVVERCSSVNMKIRIVFGESVSESLSVVGEKGATNHHSPRDIVVDIANLSVLDFGRTGFRFAKVELIEPGTVWFKSIVGVLKTADIERRGYFHTNDGFFDRILEVAAYTCYLNIQDGVLWDGIKRDRLVWSGDLNTELLTVSYTYGIVPNIKNSLELLRTETPDDVWTNNIPSYSAWWILNAVDYALFSGDLKYVFEHADYIGYILREFDSCIDVHRVDFEKTGKKTARQYFLDWPSADTPDAFVGTMMLILYMIRKLQKLSPFGLSFPEMGTLAEKLGKYREYPVDSKTIAAMQINCDSTRWTKEKLETGGAEGFSTFMAYFLLKALDKSGSRKGIELAKQYYGGMLSRGATTFWEDFDVNWLSGSGRIDEETPVGIKDLHADYGKFCYTGLRHSLCHGWSGGVVGYFVENVLGLEVLAPGFSKVRIRPNMAGLEWAEGKIPTPSGEILISAEAGGKTKVELPAGIERIL